MKNILVVDPLSELGHKNFNRFLLNVLKNDYKITFLSSNNYLDEIRDIKRIVFPMSYIGVPDKKIPFRILQVLRLFFVLILIFKNFRKQRVLFTSYETISFSFLSFLFPTDKINIVEHNNIDQLFKSKVKTFFYKCINKKVTHLCLESYISEYLRTNYRKKSFHFPHPLYSIDNNISIFNEHIFSPSSTFNIEILNDLIRFCEKKNFLLIAKGQSNLKTEFVTIKPFFVDYYKNIKKAKFVFITNYFNYRVSGVAYDALAFLKPIVGINCLFLEKMHNLYPEIVKIINHINEIENLVFDIELMKIDFAKFHEDHNKNNVRNNLLKLLNDE